MTKEKYKEHIQKQYDYVLEQVKLRYEILNRMGGYNHEPNL